MDKKKFVVTVINSVSETSMPFNEFVLHRYKICPTDRQLVIVCSHSIPDTIFIPKDLPIYCVGYSFKKIQEIMRQVKNECTNEQMKLIIHLHQPKSAVVFFASTIFQKYRKKTVFTIHSLFYAYNFINKVLSIISVAMAARVICVSEASYDHYPNVAKKIKKDKFFIVKNGVNLDRIKNIIELDEERKHEIKSLIYVARMIPIKNHRFLIEVFSRIKPCKLILIGSDSNNNEIIELIKTKRLDDRIEIVGLIPRDEVYKRLQQADIYVSPSLVEGLPVSVLEAMCIGLPSILSDIKPHLEISSQCTGVKTVPLDQAQWINTLNDYLDMDKKTLKNIGICGKHCVQDKFSLDSMLKHYDELFDEM
ncbi:MAG: glycosyltransferase family 4 protein [Syntrophomonas sp.]